MLSILDASKWPVITEANLHTKLKSALLHALGEWPNGTDIGAIADYASGRAAGWGEDDQEVLVDLATRYVENAFFDELADCSDADELHSLSETIDLLSSCCGLDVAGCHDHISERMGELAGPEPDDDDRQIRTWEDGGEVNRQVNPEAEVKRLFDGLR